MDHLAKHVHIRDRLNSLKKSFRIEQGDDLVHFLNSAVYQLRPPIVTPARSSIRTMQLLMVANFLDLVLDHLAKKTP